MRQPFNHLTWTDRLIIEKLHAAGKTKTFIADTLHRAVSTISREIKGNTYLKLNSDLTERELYSADLGQTRYKERGNKKGPDLKIGHDFELVDYLEAKIAKEQYSPAAALASIRNNPEQHFNTEICVSTLYNYIRRGDVFLTLSMKDLPNHSLPDKQKKRHVIAITPPNNQSIDNRPEKVEKRLEFGHWEMDTVHSGEEHDDNACLLAMTERKTRKEILFKLRSSSIDEVRRKLDKLEREIGVANFRKIFKSITVDNGPENKGWKEISRSYRNPDIPRTSLYYCHPYSPYERGSNENQNKLIRRFIPKGSDISPIKAKTIRKIQDWMNDYPRKILDWLTPRVLFKAECRRLGIEYS